MTRVLRKAWVVDLFNGRMSRKILGDPQRVIALSPNAKPESCDTAS
jgi:hypothetical protein